MEYYSAIKMGILSYFTTWVNLEDITVSEEISYRGTHNIWSHLYEVPKIAQHRETE